MDLFRAAVAEKMREQNTEAVLYRVQTGAFRNRKSAEELVAKLKAAGFDAIIKSEATTQEAPQYRTGTVTVSSTLNVRSGAGTSYSRTGSLTNGTKVTIIEEKNGWGKLLQGGWVSLDYVV